METNPLAVPHSLDPITGPDVDLNSADLAKITRIRLVSDPGCPFWDVSYVHGENLAGEKVRVHVSWFQIPKRDGGPVKHLLDQSPRLRRLCFVKAVLSLCQ